MSEQSIREHQKVQALFKMSEAKRLANESWAALSDAKFHAMRAEDQDLKATAEKLENSMSLMADEIRESLKLEVK